MTRGCSLSSNRRYAYGERRVCSSRPRDAMRQANPSQRHLADLLGHESALADRPPLVATALDRQTAMGEVRRVAAAGREHARTEGIRIERRPSSPIECAIDGLSRPSGDSHAERPNAFEVDRQEVQAC